MSSNYRPGRHSSPNQAKEQQIRSQHMTIEDWNIIKEVCTRFEELITSPEKTNFRCPLCQGFIEYGPLPTTAIMMAYRYNCRIGPKDHRRVERVRVEKYKKLTPDDWDQIINAI